MCVLVLKMALSFFLSPILSQTPPYEAFLANQLTHRPAYFRF